MTGPDALRGFGVSATAGVFLAMSGAFGTAHVPLSLRLAYWVGLCLAGAVVGTGVSQLVGRDGRADERPWLFGALVSLGITLPFTLVVWGVTDLMFTGGVRLASLPRYLAPVWIITTAMTALNMMVQRRPPQTHAAAAGSTPVRFLQRLPPRLRGGRLFAVEAQDHYLRLHTSKGQDLILMRLADAVAELEGIEGAQTHRSWWVAREAVTDARRGDGRAVLSLASGVEAPVSRAYARALREAGWF